MAGGKQRIMRGNILAASPGSGRARRQIILDKWKILFCFFAKIVTIRLSARLGAPGLNKAGMRC